jgi:hypothetical protein
MTFHGPVVQRAELNKCMEYNKIYAVSPQEIAQKVKDNLPPRSIINTKYEQAFSFFFFIFEKQE